MDQQPQSVDGEREIDSGHHSPDARCPDHRFDSGHFHKMS